MIACLIAMVEGTVTRIFFSPDSMRYRGRVGMQHAVHGLHGQRTQRIQYQQAKHRPGLYPRAANLIVGVLFHFKNGNNEKMFRTKIARWPHNCNMIAFSLHQKRTVPHSILRRHCFFSEAFFFLSIRFWMAPLLGLVALRAFFFANALVIHCSSFASAASLF